MPKIRMYNSRITKNNLAEISKKWADIINEKGYIEIYFVAFIEFMRLMKHIYKDFEY